MTESQAYRCASKCARLAKNWRYVVQDRDEFGDIAYAVASDFDLETFYAGASVVASFGPDGQPEIDG
ncbi:MAG: hypothetical protein AB7Q01_16800 [Gammaproteobacteria bacterium]